MELPKRTTQHVIGDQGSRVLQHSIPPNWVYRDLEGKGDYGVDGEIEIFDKETPSGLSFRVQIRSHEDCAWNSDGEYVEPVQQSTRNYWRMQTTPVVLIRCDTRLKTAYWAFVDEAETDSGVRVSRPNTLRGMTDQIRGGVAKRFSAVGPASLLLTAPPLDQ